MLSAPLRKWMLVWKTHHMESKLKRRISNVGSTLCLVQVNIKRLRNKKKYLDADKMTTKQLMKP